jgi:hypothetical protein
VEVGVSSNRNEVTLTFSVGDLPMLLHAMRIEANVAMMSGREEARTRMKRYCDAIRSLIPAEAQVFHEATWAEMSAALGSGEAWSVAHVRNDYGFYSRTGRLVVTIGDRKFATKSNDIEADSPMADAVRSLLRDLSPMDSVCLDDELQQEKAMP